MNTTEIQELLASAVDELLVGAGLDSAHQRMLVIIPDVICTPPIPLFFHLLYEQLGRRAAQPDFLATK